MNNQYSIHDHWFQPTQKIVYSKYGKRFPLLRSWFIQKGQPNRNIMKNIRSERVPDDGSTPRQTLLIFVDGLVFEQLLKSTRGKC